ncbi:MAG: hypothetical protein APR55_06345 [Methanolinea sp. SDB]|nr:MAG: hypothetical protein APR55_06345 [Methanolinea sp. SDB]
MYIYKSGIKVIDDALGGVESGTNILILVPSLCSGDRIGNTMSKPENGEFSIILSTDHPSADIEEKLGLSPVQRTHTGIIDTVTKLMFPEAADSVRVKYVPSASDLTGIGIKFTRMVEEMFRGSFSEDELEIFPPPIRFYIHSLSTLLMYRRVEVLYQFLHVITTKLKKMEALGVYVLNKESFDERTISLMKQLMNVVIEVKKDSNQEFLSINGLSGITPDWIAYQFEDGNLVIK